MDTAKIRELMLNLAGEADVKAALAKSGVNVEDAEAALKSTQGRAMRRAWLWLGRLQAELLALGGAGRAIERLDRLVEEGIEPEVQRKSAQAMLAAAGVGRRTRRTRKNARPAAPGRELFIPPEEKDEVLDLLADTLTARRIARHMDPPPAADLVDEPGTAIRLAARTDP